MGSIEPHFIKILNWNARSVRAKKFELCNFLTQMNIDVGVITETRLNPSINFSLPNHTFIRLDRPNQVGGGVAIIIKRGIRYNVIQHPKTNIIEAIGVKIHSLRGDITIFAVYTPRQCVDNNGSSALFTEDLQKLTDNRTRFIVAGDLNARHSLWRNQQCNKNGILLADHLCSGTSKIHFSDEPTFLSHSGASSTLDVFLSDLPLTKPVAHNQLSSDHYPVVCKLECSPTQAPAVMRRDYHRVEWAAFSRIVDSHIPDELNLANNQSIDNYIQVFEEAIHTAENTCIREVPMRNQFISIDPYTRHLIQQRNIVRRQFQRSGCRIIKQQVSNLNRQIKERMKIIRNEKFSEHLNQLGDYSKPFWKIAKILKQKPKAIPPLKTEIGEILVSCAEKASAIARKLVEAHNLGSRITSPHEAAVQQTAAELNERNESPFTGQISDDDVEIAVKLGKNMKAPGNDGIFNLVLKKLSRKSYRFLAAIFTKCFQLEYFPTRWKIGKVIPILKPGKDPTLPTSYRPITLLSAISKIFERIILQRLMQHIEQQQILIPEQFGFRKGHSTVHQLIRVENIINRNRSLSNNCAMALLDVEKAFDNVWHEGLIHKMVQAGFPMFLTRMIRSYLHERKFQVIVAGSRSELCEAAAGVPQGSLLSPTLYNVYTSDVPLLPAGCSLALYADDSAIIANGRQPAHYRSRLQQGVSCYVSYLHSWKIKVNEEKIQAILFKHRPSPKLSPPPDCFIQVNGCPVKWSSEITYLGVIIDEKLLYRAHTDKIKQRCTMLLQLLYPLIKRGSILSLRNKVAVFNAIIAPVVNYAMPLWGSCAEVHKKKLQVIQNRLLRTILNLPRETRISDLHRIAKCKTINERIEDAFNWFIASAQSSENTLIRAVIN